MSARPRTAASPPSPAGADTRLAALARAADLADGLLPAPAVAAARAVVARAGARLGHGSGLTVVALAGATGSGKSSLFNALAGRPLAAVGVRRPTTAAASACVWPGPDGAGAAHGLLDWLGVATRHVRPAGGGLAGLVLLDLPDHDSVRVEHRLEMERLVGLVDVLVWVLDPQKYADDAVHSRYLVPLAGHAAVMQVVLHQVDLLAPGDAATALGDLRDLLDREGLAAVPLAATSTATGEGVAALRAGLAARTAARQAAAARLTADAVAAAAGLDAGCGTGRDLAAAGAGRARTPAGPGPAPAPPGADPALVAALARAAGADAATAAVAASVRRRGNAAAGWPVTRWAGRLRPDPLRRLRLPGAGPPAGAGPRDAPGGTGLPGRTNLPAPGPGAMAAVATAARDAADRATAGLPAPWPDLARRAATAGLPRLPDALDRAVAGVPLAAPDPSWWRWAGAAQAASAAVAAAGALWLAALAVLSWLRVDGPDGPRIGPFALPAALLAGGLLAGALLALLARRLTAGTARRRARAARRRLDGAVAAVAAAHVLAPVADVVARRTALCAALAEARG